MARAQAYDEWDDPGMAVSEDECLAYSPQEVAQGRVKEVVQAVRLLLRMNQTGQDKPATTEASAKRLLDVATWYCRAAGLEGVSRDEVTTLPAPSTAEGKKLSASALKTTAPDLIAMLRERAEADLRRSVTLGRRCEGARRADGKWSREDRSASNRLANAILKEATTCEKLLELWASTTKGASDG